MVMSSEHSPLAGSTSIVQQWLAIEQSPTVIVLSCEIAVRRTFGVVIMLILPEGGSTANDHADMLESVWLVVGRLSFK